MDERKLKEVSYLHFWHESTIEMNNSLSQVFRLAGRVVGVELQRDKEGKSRGFAVVVYDHPVEAVQAISMLNNQQLFDRFTGPNLKVCDNLVLQEIER